MLCFRQSIWNRIENSYNLLLKFDQTNQSISFESFSYLIWLILAIDNITEPDKIQHPITFGMTIIYQIK